MGEGAGVGERGAEELVVFWGEGVAAAGDVGGCLGGGEEGLGPGDGGEEADFGGEEVGGGVGWVEV